jgi:branched-chain amino acid transport system substrate-binding protein
VYSSLPLQGPDSIDARAIEKGINLALWDGTHNNQAGILKINYTPLNDATKGSHGWDQQRTLANAMRAASDPKAVYYIGEFDSGASAISIPILNQAGISQVSPGSGYVGLTGRVPAAPDATLPAQSPLAPEPDRYYPAGPDSRNFVRLIPSDAVQAAADAEALRSLRCTRVALASDKTQYGISLAALIHATGHQYGLAVGAPTQIDPNTTDFRTYVEQLRVAGANCLAYAGSAVSTSAVDLVREIHALYPSTPIVGTDGVCSDAWTEPSISRKPTPIDPLMYCTRPTLPLDKYPGGSSVLQLYHSLYGPHAASPDPWLIYGYEAMKLAIETITQLVRQGADRGAVRQALFETAGSSVLGVYGITPLGETTLTQYGLYRASAQGSLDFSRVLDPAPLILRVS